ncbi:MAG: helix-turn-helix domain-containing protein [Propionibacteriaceae bacterium]|jgi:transcriptional regulator with XRE-family HTH domain|nr:helix-turn-helix domain-containing protein [Propionibacteriaceae bacterium]
MVQIVPDRKPLLREAIGEALRELRVERGLTLRALASRSLVSLGYLSELERGRKEASSELLNSVCEALGVSLPSLLHLAAAELQPAKVIELRPAAVPERVAA